MSGKSKGAMDWRGRLLLLGTGAFFILSGWGMLEQRRFAYRNYLGAEMYAPALIVTGIVIGLLGLLPAARGKNKKKHHER